jgi:hypothetical protein
VLVTLHWEKQAAANNYQTHKMAVWILKIAEVRGFRVGRHLLSCSDYFSFSYSALAAFKTGTSGSASFQGAKKSW